MSQAGKQMSMLSPLFFTLFPIGECLTLNNDSEQNPKQQHVPLSQAYKQISILFFRRRASPGQYMIFVTILSVSLNGRKFFEFTHNMDGSDYETTSLMEYKPYIVFSNTWQELVVTGALPFIVLVVSNINIYLKIRESSKHESHRYVLTRLILYFGSWKKLRVCIM